MNLPPLKRQRTHEAEVAFVPDELGGDPRDWKDKSIVSVEQISPAGLELVLRYAEQCARLASEGTSEVLKGKVMAAVFYEASTRTSCSFQAAMHRLGGSVIPVASTTSSAKKGETLSDTIRCLECYCDILILRHPEKGSANIAALASSIPIINAGDGTGEHPTQALLDLYTMRSELGGNAPSRSTIALVGDLKNGRTVHSLAVLLARGGFDGMTLLCVSPPELAMPQSVVQQVERRGITLRVATLEEATRDADILYVTRVQKERFASEAEYEKVKGSYVIDAELMRDAKQRMAVMHPLPRVDEIKTDVDNDPRAAYFRQMKNGMYVRMALLCLCAGRSPAL